MFCGSSSRCSCGLQYVIVVFSDHTHLLFEKCFTCFYVCVSLFVCAQMSLLRGDMAWSGIRLCHLLVILVFSPRGSVVSSIRQTGKPGERGSRQADGQAGGRPESRHLGDRTV